MNVVILLSLLSTTVANELSEDEAAIQKALHDFPQFDINGERILDISEFVRPRYGVEVVSQTPSVLAGRYRLEHKTLNNRPVYRKDQIYLYHKAIANETGRWMIGPYFGELNGVRFVVASHCFSQSRRLAFVCVVQLAYIDSWALTPSMIQLVSPKSQWHLALGFQWTPDVTVYAKQLGYAPDRTVYVTSHVAEQSYHIDGYYVETGLTNEQHMLYINAWRQQILYLYFHQRVSRWLIGRKFDNQLPEVAF
jgi:hypothetical protein